MLFIPWRDEAVDLLAGHSTFCDSYEANRVPIRQVERLYVKNAEAFEQAVEDLSKGAVDDDAWDNLAPNVRSEEAECQQEGREEITDFNAIESLEHSTPHVSHLAARFRTDSTDDLLSPDDYCNAMRELNEQQNNIVMFNRRWVKSFVFATNRRQLHEMPKPYFVFLSGAGGVGKSHVIRLIRNDCIKLLRHCRYYGDCVTSPVKLYCILLPSCYLQVSIFFIRRVVLVLIKQFSHEV